MTRQEATISVLGLLLINVVARVLPHAPNFAPVTASGLFCGAYMGRRVSLPVTLLILILSDYALLYVNPYGRIHLSAFYSPRAIWYGGTQLFVYASFGISALAGQWLRTHRSATDIVVVALFCSLQFFFMTNAAVWLMGAYDRGPRGLYESLVAGLPFFRGTLAGDLLYTAAFFGLWEIVKARKAEPATST